MTAYVKFYVDATEKKLKIEADVECANKLETIFAKKTLSIASRLAFTELQQIGVFDVGASIVIETSPDYADNSEELVNTFNDYIKENGEKATVFKISPDGKKAIPVESKIFLDKKEDEVSTDDTSWKLGENEIKISLNLYDANEVIGGLASVSATSAMTVYVLLKKTLESVNTHYGVENKQDFEYDDEEEYAYSYQDDGY